MIRYLFAFVALLSSPAFSQEQTWKLGTAMGLHGGVPVAGLELSLPVTENVTMNYAFTRGQTSLVDQLDSNTTNLITRADFDLAEYSIIFRYLLSETFYVGAGAGYRQMQLDFTELSWMNARGWDGSVHSEALQARLLIGNVWNFSNGVYLGVDWIGLGVPLNVTTSDADIVETSSNSRTLLTAENNQQVKHDVDTISRATMGTVLTLRLGIAL